MSMVKRLLRDEAGATSIEYAFIASGIAMAIVVVVKNIGQALVPTFTTVQNGLK